MARRPCVTCHMLQHSAHLSDPALFHSALTTLTSLLSFLSQGLCTGCSLCLECSPPRHPLPLSTFRSMKPKLLSFQPPGTLWPPRALQDHHILSFFPKETETLPSQAFIFSSQLPFLTHPWFALGFAPPHRNEQHHLTNYWQFSLQSIKFVMRLPGNIRQTQKTTWQGILGWKNMNTSVTTYQARF